jgi:hypothetical protein
MTGDGRGEEDDAVPSGGPIDDDGSPTRTLSSGIAPRKPALGWLRDWLRAVASMARSKPQDVLSAWQERYYAKRASTEVLEAYQRVHTQRPELAGRALYRQVVMVRTGIDAKAADALLQSAEQSFAEWPVQRELDFRDVAHYLVYDGYMRSFGSRHWTRRHIGHIVDSVIPAKL